MNRICTRVLIQSNAISSAHYMLSLQEIRLYHLCLVQIPRFSQVHSGYFKIAAPLYHQVFNVDMSQSYKDIKNALLAWKDRRIRIYTEYVPWLRSVLTFWPKGYALVRLNQRLLKELVGLQSQFTMLDMQDLRQLNSVPALRLYHSLMQFRQTGFWRVTLPMLHQRFHLSKSYLSWSALRERVLEPSLKMINERTRLNVRYECLQQGRKITGLCFGFHRDDTA